jgi:hypothetical protein
MPNPIPTMSLSRPARLLPGGALALALAFLAACGGGGGGATVSQPPAPPAAGIAGVWTYTDNTGVVYHTLVLPDTHVVRSLDSNMAAGVGYFTLIGTTLGGSITVYPPAIYSAYPVLTGTVSGTATEGHLDDTITFSLGVVNSHLVPDTAANTAVQLADLAGTYAADPAHTSTGVASTLTVNADGTFTLVNASGTGQGSFTPVAAGLNAFTTTLDVTPASGSSASFTGHSFLRPGTAASICLMTSNATGGNSGMFTRQ